jgi:hypothetical protein
MLIVPGVDPSAVLSRALIWCALICCTLVALSFVLFALDQVSHASKQQVNQLATGTASPSTTHATSTSPGQPRRFIDDAARTLTSPFRSLVGSNSQWSMELASTLLALLVYGLGLGYLARYSRVT